MTYSPKRRLRGRAASSSRTQRRRGGSALYLAPILIGLFGVLFSARLVNPVARYTAIVLSVGVSLLACGNLLARLRSPAYQRLILTGGIVMLTLGAMVAIFMFSETHERDEITPESTQDVSRWLGAAGLVLGLLATVYMVVRREEEIEEIRQRFGSLAARTSDGFLLFSPNGVILLANQRLLNMLGCAEEDIVGHNIDEWVSRLPLEPAPEQEENGGRQYRFAWRKGEKEFIFWVTESLILDRRGRLAGALITVRDITEQQRLAERLERYAKDLQVLVEERTQELRESEQRLRDLLVSMNEGFVTLDATYRIRFANAKFCELAQADPERLIGQSVFDLVDAAHHDRLRELLRHPAPDDSGSRRQEVALLGRTGDSTIVVAAVTSIRDAGEREAHYSLVTTDVTELKRMQHELVLRARELEAANEELRSLGQAKDSFLANVTHELRTPLSTIRGYVEMLHSGTLGDLATAQAAALRVMTRNIDRLATLIDELIECSRLEIQGLRLTRTLFSVGNVLHDCATSLQPQLLAKNMTLTVNIAADVRFAWGDRKRVLQVLANLVSNAIKFSEKDGRVTIGAARWEESDLALAVSDKGIGIDPALHKKVFEKFFQVDASPSRRFEGAGIGLAVAKGIAEAHGGRIDLQSEPGRGSTFTMILPGALFDVSAPVGPESPDSGKRAVVVADEEEFRTALQAILRSEGWDAGTASSGYEALREMKTARPALVLMDAEAADVSGAAVITQLRQEPSTEFVPVVLLTDEEVSATNVAAAEHIYAIRKPFSARALMNLIRSVTADTHPSKHSVLLSR